MRDFPHIGCGVFAVRAGASGRDHLSVAQPATEARLSSAIAAALDEICEDLERYHVRQEQRLQLARCIAAADELIEELEGLSLAGSAVVPPGWQARLDRFAGSLPVGVASGLQSGGEPNRLLDQVFAIEERLFRLKLGEWAQRYDASLADGPLPDSIAAPGGGKTG
jgi:hypothetical protein